MKKTLFISTFAILVFSAFTLTGSWKKYKYKDLGFKAHFPSKPTVSEESIPTETGQININMYNASFEEKAFMIAVNEYPSEYLNENTPEEDVKFSLRNGLVGAASSLKGELVSSKFFKYGKYHGIEGKITFQDGGDAIDMMRIILVGNIMYQMQVLGMKKDRVETNATIFFGGFELY